MLLKKTILLLLSVTAIVNISIGQKNKEYPEQWKKVETYEKKGLTASALKEVINIYNLAIQDKNDAQQIKACMYQIRYRNMTEEDSQEKNIFFVDTLIAKAKAPAKNILQSMQAEMMWQYLQNHRWQFYNRTQLKEEKSRDISTWSLEKLHAAITALYKASLDIRTEEVLKATKLDGFDAVIIKGKNTRNLRPTLYDFLVFRALDYFMTDERDVIKPAYQFTINDPLVFAPASEFAQHRFKTKDTASFHYHALELLRHILTWHIADTKADGLLDADLIRLNFVYQYAVNEDKEKLYESALKNIEEKYPSYEASAQAMYLRAKIYYDKGQSFDPFTKTDNQYEIKRAKELLEAAIKKYPQSEGGINAQNLLNSILQPSLSLESEKVNVPLQPFRTLVKYKNVKTVYFRLIKTSRDEIKKFDRRDYDKMWQGYIAMKPIKSWNVTLPDPLDYQQHSTEIKVDAVDNGVYFLLASIDENFSLDKNIIAKQLTYVSNISYIHNNDIDYYVLNRDNGQPLVNSKVQVWESKYNYNTSRYEEIKAEQYTTDKNGLFKLKKTKEYRTIQLQITSGSDELFMDENNNDYYSYNSYEQPKETTQTFLFTDRSIYRPGQTVFFKGIVINKASKVADSKVIAAFNSTIQLKDANGQKLNELKMTTNEYGSYHGSFKLPEGSLNGQFSLFDSAGNGYHSFSVEEYKRPKFSVEVKKPSGTYRVNDSIKVTGIAKAYAGNNIDGAAVKYRVVRKVRYQPWWEWGYVRRGRKIWPPYGRNEEVEITNGTAVTDSKGEFTIRFKALPDESIDKKDQPTFYYEVNADVTDLNGETRSGETSVAVAYQSLQLEIKLDDKLPADSMKNILVKSTNLNDIEEKANITVTIHQLKSPGKIFRERYWDQPDQYVMSKDEYYSYFPYDVYASENEVKNYLTGDKIFDKTDSSNKEWKIENGKWKAGWYKVIAATKDKYGEDVKTEKYILLTGNGENKTDPITVNVTKQKAEPGETIKYDIKTGFDNVWLIHSIAKMNNVTEVNYPAIEQNRSFTNEIAVTENDRGGIAMNYVFIKHNRVYSGDESFNIPWSNKELSISYQTFRDKLLPGTNEKWTVTISGNKGEKVSAEMLAGMYDASLDQFKGHGWSRINIFPDMNNQVEGWHAGFAYFRTTVWNNIGFEKIIAEEHNTERTNYLDINKSYDQLIGSYSGNMFRERYYKKGAYNFEYDKAESMSAAPAAQAMETKLRGDGTYDSSGNVIGQKTLPDEKEEETPNKAPNNENIQIRKNFNETAFFFPDLTTDAEGNVSFSVIMPEALTQWKLMTLAHTKDLKSGYTEKTLVTQKPLMVQPNAPRFMREGDKMEFSTKIVNLLDTFFSGTVTLELFDAATNKPVDNLFKNISSAQSFTTWPNQSVSVKFAIEIPKNFNSALLYRVKAIATVPNYQAGETFSDGEEMALPVLTNRVLVTESIPLNLRNVTKKDFKFEKLINSSNSKTISNHALTVEYTSNPAWYAVQALPYLMEYPYECAEQTFNRYYANTLASYVTNSIPKLKAVFEKWKTADTAALLSNLQKNEELKSALLQETPWVIDAQNETQQKKNIVLLFDMVKMSNETNKAINKLKEMQSSNGGFVWFKGGPDDRYITQYIITGIGHLKKLNALSINESQQQKDIMAIVKKAIPYLDKKIKEEYDNLIKNKIKLRQNNLSYTAIQYLYMRSFFTETLINEASQKAVDYYLQQAKKYWLSNGKYMQAMIALSLQRNGDTKTPKVIIQSLKENSISNEELGMYWKDWTNRGWFWHQAPIESQALIIEAFTEIDKNQATIDDLKTWLLKQKQTQNWGTTKATAEACYALLLNGSDWLKEEKEVTINLGSTTIKSDNEEAGTGYFKEKIEGKDVKPGMGNINVTIQPLNNSTMKQSTSWGSVYWQYFEDLDKITSAETPLKLVKKLFVERNTDKGPVLDAIENGAQLKVGDKVKVRIELRVDRDMEYVHMKDMRAACMEPVNVLSGYKYQDGLGYYETTKDASTNFFFNWLNRGTYVFEYPLFVTHEGDFSNGITTIQCMYAPEFTSHSEGIRITVK